MSCSITKREQEVLHLLTQDYTTKELAQCLFVSTETINSHRKNLRSKLGVKTTAGLVWKGVQLGLLSKPRFDNRNINGNSMGGTL